MVLLINPARHITKKLYLSSNSVGWRREPRTVGGDEYILSDSAVCHDSVRQDAKKWRFNCSTYIIIIARSSGTSPKPSCPRHGNAEGATSTSAICAPRKFPPTSLAPLL